MAEDDEDDRMLFNEALRDICHQSQLQFARDGVELMDTLESRAGSLPQLILLDINMPQKDGIECLKSIRSSKKFENIPVAIFSTNSHQELVDASYQAGADLYIPKPAHYEKLQKIISYVLSINWRQHVKPLQTNFMLNI